MGHTRAKHNPSNHKLVNVSFTERRNRTGVTLPLEKMGGGNEVECKPGKQKLRKAAAETPERRELKHAKAIPSGHGPMSSYSTNTI